jgi:opacity protein-like surface antigen
MLSSKYSHYLKMFSQKHVLKSLCLSLATYCMVSVANPAKAEDIQIQESAPISQGGLSGFYITTGVGANWPIDRVGKGERGIFTEFSNPGFSGEVGLGYEFKPLRLELTYALDASNLEGYNNVSGKYFKYVQGGQTRKNSAFASVYWDLLASKRLSPYVGVGMGLTFLNVGAFSDPGLSYQGYSKSLFGYQAKAGLSYAINHRSKVPITQTMDSISGTIHLSLVGGHKLALGSAFDNSRF